MADPPSAVRVLLVDDEPTVANIWSRLLAIAGMQVSVYRSGDVALSEFERRPNAIDVAVIDSQMPTMSGSRLADRLWQMRPDLPIILVSGDPDGLRLPAPAGPHQVMAKPLGAIQLVAAIRQLVRRRT